MNYLLFLIPLLVMIPMIHADNGFRDCSGYLENNNGVCDRLDNIIQLQEQQNKLLAFNACHWVPDDDQTYYEHYYNDSSSLSPTLPNILFHECVSKVLNDTK